MDPVMAVEAFRKEYGQVRGRRTVRSVAAVVGAGPAVRIAIDGVDDRTEQRKPDGASS